MKIFPLFLSLSPSLPLSHTHPEVGGRRGPAETEESSFGDKTGGGGEKERRREGGRERERDKKREEGRQRKGKE